jgi:hypothetical protein
MTGQFRGKVAESMEDPTGHDKSVGDRVAEGTKRGSGSNNSGGFGNNEPTAFIQDHMDVIASCGTKVGVVDHVEGKTIKLTKNDSPDKKHHFIPTAWVDHVDKDVHLSKNSKETEQNWKNDAASCGCI